MLMKKQSGFTLIELVVVIVILGILAATALPKFVDLSGEAAQAAVKGVAGQISSASAINMAKRKISSTTAGTTAVSVATSCAPAVLGPLLEGGKLPASYSVAAKTTGADDCTAATGNTSIICTLTEPNNSKTADAVVYCVQ